MGDDVAVFERAQAGPVAVSVVCGLRVMGGVQLTVLLILRPKVAYLALPLDYFLVE